ncbi:MAG: phosphotransferase [Clostridium sp.]|nr:phosphotransferase [Clostridium sp.]
MKKIDYVVLSAVVRGHCAAQREVAAQTGYPLGLVSASLQYLIREGYLAEDYFLTQKTIEMFRRNAPRQAVILAAGPGKRMVPINGTPKALMTIGGESLIERLINQLHRTGIYNIAVVVGYEKEKFEYLTGLYNVELIENPGWAQGDSLHSLNCAASLLNNCYVIDGNVWSGESLFSRSEYSSWYAVRSYYDDSSMVRVTREMELVEAEGGNAMCGVAYLCADDAAMVRGNLERLCADPEYRHACWEQALIGPNGQMAGYANVITGMLVVPVNTYEDLRVLDSESKHLESRRIALICELFDVPAAEITDLHALSSGMTNHLMHFSCKGKEYLMRSPGEGTRKLVSRQKESAVYKALASTGMDISDKVLYLNPETGYKVTEFWTDARACDPENPKEVEACMRHLRRFHQQQLQLEFRFDLRAQLDYYEELRQDSMPFADYDLTRRHVDELLRRAEACPREECLSHIDSVYDNFLFVRREDGSEQVRLIDWEYSGVSDPHLDIAMFCIYAYYDKEQIDQTIDFYFDGRCPEAVRQKIYCYIAAAGLLWTNWCEYKSRMGVRYGAYEMRQYQYAKQFYEYVVTLWPDGVPAADEEERI